MIRHAKAGDRSTWTGDDRLRPLTKSGRRQAEALRDQLANDPIDLILSSPYTRCVETVQPLAIAKKLAVQPTDALAEGAGGERIIDLIRQHQGKNLAMCTHGDLVDELLEILIKRGLISRARASNEKGGIWVLEAEAGELTGAKYRAAP